MKHTFKKWHAQKPDGSNGYWYIGEEGRTVGGTVVYPYDTEAEAESRARLIAAAPELLALAQEVVAKSHDTKLIHQARAAIATATKEG